MGLLDKIEDKLSSNKNKNQDPALANEGVATTGHTGQGSHFDSNTTGGTSGITGGTHVGNTGAGNYGPGPASNTAGPHSANLANKGDPRVDSDLDNTRGGYGSNVGGGVGGAHTGTGIGGTHSGAGNYGPGPASNTAGPHSSNLANKADPRVDSDLDNTRGGYGSNVGGTHTTGAGVGGTYTGAHTGAGNYGPGPAQNTAGPHKSDMMNKLDPRVDSDLDSSRGAHGSHTTGAAGTHGQQHADLVPGSHPAANNPSAIPTAGGERVGSIPGGNNQYDATNSRATGPGSNTAGPHNSNIMNKLDPRVDSDLDSNRNTHGTHGATGGFGSSNTPLANDSSFNQRHGGAGVGATGAGNYGPGPASNTAGPHSSNLANKADPRVDSDLDNARGGYGQQGYAGTTGHNTTGNGLTGSHNTTGGGLTGSSHHNTTGGGLTGSSHNTGDNRTMMEKAKDKLIPSRNDRPDDPVTGTNVGQSNVPGNTTGHTYGSGTTGADTTTGRNW